MSRIYFFDKIPDENMSVLVDCKRINNKKMIFGQKGVPFFGTPFGQTYEGGRRPAGINGQTREGTRSGPHCRCLPR